MHALDQCLMSMAVCMAMLHACMALAQHTNHPSSGSASAAKAKVTVNMTEQWLLDTLSRAATVSGFLSPGIGSDQRMEHNTSDTIRMLANTQTRYAGRSVFLWGHEEDLPKMLPAVKANAAIVHAQVRHLRQTWHHRGRIQRPTNTVHDIMWHCCNCPSIGLSLS